MRRVMKIGPLRLEGGRAHAYVASGEGGLEFVAEESDEKGLAALRRKCGNEPLVCEPALARAAAAQGLTVAELPQRLVALKAALAVIFDHGRTLAAVSPDLMFELIEAMIAFQAAAPWEGVEPDEPLSIRIDPPGRELEGCVLGAGGEELGLALYHQPGSIERVARFMDEGRPEA